MKNKLLKTIIMMSKCFLYGLILQTLMLNLVLALDANGQYKKIEEVRVTLSADQLSLDQFFREVQRQTPFKFSYEYRDVDPKLSLSFAKKEGPVIDFLREAAQQSPLSFRQVNHGIDVLKRRGKSQELAVSSISVQIIGKVTDEKGDPIPGVTVIVERTNMGTVTDLDGNFSIETGENTVLIFSFIGYQSQRVTIGNQTSINVILKEDQKYLDEVVVVGYGVQEKLSVTNSLVQVSGEMLERRPVADFQQSLQGLAPGVTVLDRGGRPGSSNINIRIRGITTLGNNNPLIIVDGIEQRLNDINPNDIESVTVLKDASSAAIYGSRAANGVILVTTKRGGTKGDMNVRYDGYFALQDVTNRPEHMNLDSYFRLENVAFANAGRPIPYTEEFIQNYVANAPSPQYPLPFPFWQRDEFGILKTAPQQNHTLSISGGSENFSGRMSVRHQRIDGVVSNFNDNLNEFRVNLDMKASQKLRFSGDLNYRSRESLQPTGLSSTGNGEGVVFQFMLHASKFAWPKHETGEYGLGPQVNNPLLLAELTGDSRTTNNYLTGSFKADYEIIPNLVFSTQYALRYDNTQIKTFSNRFINKDPLNGRLRQKPMNSLNESRINMIEYTLNSLLTYNKVFGNHKTIFLLGYSTIDNNRNQIGAFRQNFYNNDIQALSQGSDVNRNATGFEAEWGLRSFFSRFNYNYSDKYFLEINGRYDGSSRFSKENRYSFFPSFSTGWRLSEEAFWNPIKPVINEFKLRGSRGTTGNQAVGLYTFFETLNAINYSFNGQPVQGFVQSNLANRELTWETTLQTNFGVDMGFLDDKLLFSMDYYQKTTEGILLQLPIPALIGLGAPVQNAGVVRNKGYEIGLNYKGGRKLTYDLGINFSDNKNEVIDLVNSGPYISGGTSGPRFIIEEGLPINSHWGYLTGGIFQTQDEIDSYPKLRPNTAPGDVKYLDVNGDGIINEADHQNLGLSFPRFDFGMNGNLRYGNFDLFFQFQGSAGHKTRLDGAFQQIATFEAFTHAIYTDNFWTPDRRDAEFPRPIKGDGRNFLTSDAQLIDASYLRLKNIVIGYNLPVEFLNKISMKSARIFVGATNLITFSELNRWDLDPEIPSGRGQYYPQVSMYSVGVNFQF